MDALDLPFRETPRTYELPLGPALFLDGSLYPLAVGRATLAGLKQKYSRIFFIGDTRQDLQAGKDAGVPVFLVKVGAEGESWLEAEKLLAQFVAGK